MNISTAIDGYKLDHRRQYPQGTESVYSNLTPRGSRVKGETHVVFFGLQYFLKKYLMEEFNRGFFEQNVEKVCEKYARRVNGYLGPNTIGTDHIRALHNLGYLPLEFKALPEGTHVPLRVPMFTVVNTVPEFFWLTNYFETLLSNVLWMPTTSATTASQFRRVLDQYAERTGSPKEFVDWQGHDFSFRGMPGLEAAMISGAGHLLFFTGTDTIPAIDLIEEYYPTETFIAGSVAATEHSVVCAGGEGGERETVSRLIDLYPEGIFSYVSDTWDLWRLLTEILPSLKREILNRNGKMVIRPDSGDPVKIICGDKDAPYMSPAYKGVIQLLWEVFGGTTTSRGYKLLDSHIGCIYGDSINIERLNAILEGLEENGFASANMVFGMGSFTYQYVTRDTYNMAMKATHCEINGTPIDMFKKPITDNGMKESAKGMLAVLRDKDGNLYLKNQATVDELEQSELKTVWKDGQFKMFYDYAEVRARARA
jgi:nicotinamide phosphoribosyltransferase